MHLEMKAQCEKCGGAVPADGEAYICSYECTFCPPCAANTQGTCPNCGGELIRRPRRKAAIGGAEHGPLQTQAGKHPGLIWAVSFALWTFIAVASGISLYQVDRSLGRPTSLTSELTLPLINGLIYALLTPLVFGLALRSPVQRSNWARRSGFYVAGSLAFTLLHVFLRGLVYPVWDPRVRSYAYAAWNPQTHILSFQWILFERLFLYNLVDDIFSIYLPIVLIAHAVCYYRRFRDRELRASELETQLAKAHLQALKSQIQPHFLFNTMHSISALMLTDVRAADKMMARLSDLLRMSMENAGIQLTTLSRELEFVTCYLEIEKVRFEDRLNLVFDIASDTLDAQVPHFLLQPFAENAIRHGIAKRSTQGEIRITASRDERDLDLRVTDNGPGIDQTEGLSLADGLGLRTSRERLRTLYGADQSLDMRNAPGGGLEIKIRIPFHVEPRPLLHEVELKGPKSVA
jgi:two-component system, LytTR family, sensor kinase